MSRSQNIYPKKLWATAQRCGLNAETLDAYLTGRKQPAGWLRRELEKALGKRLPNPSDRHL